MSPRDRLLGLPDAELARECELDRFRGSGPGGQKRNKTESAVRLRHLPTGLVGLASDSRSQAENRMRALRRLREHAVVELRDAVGVDGYQAPAALAALVAAGTAPRGPRQRQQAEYLLGMAQLLDLFAATGCSVSETGRRLGLSTGATSKLLLGDQRIGAAANQLRAARGMRPLS
jgi:peptide chain release factor-like protein